MKINKAKWFVSFIVLILASQSLLYAQKHPNIILIIGDDISRDDIGAYGKNAFIKTPHLDSLATQGFLFTQFFVTSSSCSPSRVSLLTGRYPHNTGAPELHQSLPANQIYFPEILKQNGYFTGLVGKWHEGENTKRAYDTLITGVPLNGNGGEDQWISILQNRPKDKPFFFWLATFDAHREWDIENRFRHSPDSVFVPKTLVDSAETRKDLASYYNEIERIDFNMGKLVSELKRQNILENTILIFLGDNGRPFPGDKTRLLDRGTNTPLIISAPQYSNNSRIVDALVSGVDIAPTILTLANMQTIKKIQGRSFISLLLSPMKKDFRHYVFSEHNWHDYQAYERAIRTKDFLYINNKLPQLPNQGPLDVVKSPSFKDLLKGRGNLTPLQNDIFKVPRSAEELYDVHLDNWQEQNLINLSQYKSSIQQLRKVLNNWQNTTKDDFPKDLTPDWYGRWEGEVLPTINQRGTKPGTKSGSEETEKRGEF